MTNMTINTNPSADLLLSISINEVKFRKGQLITAKIRADFTGEDRDKKEVNRIIRELEIAENSLSVICEKLGVNQENDEAIKALYA